MSRLNTMSQVALAALFSPDSQSTLVTLLTIYDPANENAPEFSRASTATYIDGGVLKYAAVDEPRYQSGVLLVEGASTNLLTYSNDFSNATWIKVGSTFTQNSSSGPDGTQTATLFVPTTSGVVSSARLLRSFTQQGSDSYTASVFVKSAGRRWVYFTSPDATSDQDDCWFDLQNGVVGTKGSKVLNATIQSVGNGWFRISTTSVACNYFYLSTPDSNGSKFLTANGNGLYIWGAQIEPGPVATSYIPTTTAPVTRAADKSSVLIRLADNYTQRLSDQETDTDILYGIRSRGIDYHFLPMEVTLPSEEENSAPRCSIVLTDVTKQLVPIIRQISGPPRVKIELVLNTSPDIVEASFDKFYMSSISYDSNQVTAELAMIDFAVEPFPAYSFTPKYFPGLF